MQSIINSSTPVLEPLLEVPTLSTLSVFEIEINSGYCQQVCDYFKNNLQRFWDYQEVVDLKIFYSCNSLKLQLLLCTDPTARQELIAVIDIVLDEMRLAGLIDDYSKSSDTYELLE